MKWQRYFPFKEVRHQQKEAMDIVTKTKNPRVVLEQSTGVGKTAEGICFLRWLKGSGVKGSLVYIAPTKALIDQIAKQYPSYVHKLYGRHEYDCIFYHLKGIEAKADEIPCTTIVKGGLCPHYEASMGRLKGIDSCPYFDAKIKAEKSGKIVLMTKAYFLLSKLFNDWPEEIAGLVIDEVHQIAKIARLVFAYEITDYHLKRLVDLLRRYPKADHQANRLEEFLNEMIRIASLKPSRQPTLLQTHEIEHLISYLQKVNLDQVTAHLERALVKGELDPIEHKEELMTFERITRDLNRYLISLRYALADKAEKRNPLNYIVSYYEKRIPRKRKVRHKLIIKAHYVAPLIRYTLKDIPNILAYSATIGDPQIFSFETGITFPVYSFPSPFPPENARIFVPKDTPNLAFKYRRKMDLYLALRKVAKAVLELQNHGIRCLVVVESNKELRKFLELSKRLGLNVISYDENLAPKEAAIRFLEGEGMVLAGTSANYSHGLDLPGDTAPVIFFLRPGYPKPQDPATQFEILRFGEREAQKLWRWRALIEALQVRGRNIRADEDLGVAIFISQQFRNLIPSGLPKWLEKAWKEKELQGCIKEALEFLKKEKGGHMR